MHYIGSYFAIAFTSDIIIVCYFEFRKISINDSWINIFLFLVRPGVEFAFGALAAVGAGFFTNPTDVVKVRLQLQGELEARGAYKKIYKNTVHAAYLIAKHEGVLALQAGLVPALAFQVVLNGIRLGAYKSAQRYELIVDKQGNTDVFRTVIVSGTAGCVGAVLGSPLYLVIILFLLLLFFIDTFDVLFQIFSCANINTR